MARPPAPICVDRARIRAHTALRLREGLVVRTGTRRREESAVRLLRWMAEVTVKNDFRSIALPPSTRGNGVAPQAKGEPEPR